MVSSGAIPAVSEHFKQSKEPVMVWEEEEPWGPYIINAIKAEHLYIRDKDYIVEDELHVKIISRSTGRVQSKSRWTDNIHQARRTALHCLLTLSCSHPHAPAC